MQQTSVTQVLQAYNFKNGRTGSVFCFAGDKVVINNETIGSYLVQEKEECLALVISTPDLGSIELEIRLTSKEGRSPRITWFKPNESIPFIELVAE